MGVLNTVVTKVVIVRLLTRTDKRIYVTNAMTGMYISGEFRSSRGGKNIDEYCCWVIWPFGPADAAMRACWRDQGLCRQGKRTSASLLST